MKLGVLLVAALVLAVLNRPMRRVWKLVVVLANLAPGPLTPLINRLSPRVTGETGQIATGKGEQYPLKIYHPPSSRASPAVILYPGATSAGEEHEVVNRVGRSLARIGLRTFLPGLPRLKEAKVEERTVEEMVDVFESVTGRGDVDPDRVVVAGMSFGGSLLVKASMDDRMRGKPAAVLSYGSYFDLERALEFALSGDFTDDTHHYHFQPDAWGRIVFFHNFLDEVDGDFDRDNVRSYFGTYVEQGEAEAVSVYDGFPERDRNFIDGIMRGSGGEGLTVARQVLPGIKNTLRSLSPKTFLNDIDFPLFLMHGANDAMVPWTETAAFQKALLSRGKQVTAFISYLHAHSDVEVRRRDRVQVVRELWKTGRFLNAVLEKVL